jgi:hypothetical protein
MCWLLWWYGQIFSFLKNNEWIALWVEGLALVAIFIWDRRDAKNQHKETLKQIELAQDQIKISQNAERAWVLTELEWPEDERLRVVIGTSKERDNPQLETTTVVVRLVCRNEGRSPAWIDKIQGYGEIMEGRLRDLASPVGHKAQPFLPVGPIAPGKGEWRNLHVVCPGHLKNAQLLSLFVLVEYRDIFEKTRITTCGYTVSGTFLDRQDTLPERNKMT